MKKHYVLAFALAAALCATPVFAEEGKPAKKDAPSEESQQNRMKRCNLEAGKKELRGDERRAFMSSCLKGSHAE